MMKRNLLFGSLLFIAGLIVGGIWSPRHHGDLRSSVPSRTVFSKHLAESRTKFGDEAAEFLEQFKDFTIRSNEDPIYVAASSDGRFTVQAFGRDETIASELRYAAGGKGGRDALVRYYGLLSGDKTWACNLTWSADKSRIDDVSFSISDSNGHGLTYMDTDADGRWDKLTDTTQAPPAFYRREALCWVKCKTAENE